MQTPYILDFPKIGSDQQGFLVPFEHIPFVIQHVYCIGPVPEEEQRGNHAKKLNNQVLIAIGGKAKLNLESPEGCFYEFELESNNKGLFIPCGYWRSAKLFQGCYLLGLHSIKYTESDYVRDYEEFKRLNNR